MNSNRYEVRGVLLPEREPLPIPGIYVYLDFVITGHSGSPELVHPYPDPNPDNYEGGIIRSRLQQDSTIEAIKVMSSTRYLESRPGISIDLDTQVICEDHTGEICIFDAEKLYLNRADLLKVKRATAKRWLDERNN